MLPSLFEVLVVVGGWWWCMYFGIFWCGFCGLGVGGLVFFLEARELFWLLVVFEHKSTAH